MQKLGIPRDEAKGRTVIAPRRRRLSHTTEARLALLLAPVFLPVALAWNVPGAIRAALREFFWHANFGGVWSDFYRNVYRVARYGSVHDDE